MVRLLGRRCSLASPQTRCRVGLFGRHSPGQKSSTAKGYESQIIRTSEYYWPLNAVFLHCVGDLGRRAFNSAFGGGALSPVEPRPAFRVGARLISWTRAWAGRRISRAGEWWSGFRKCCRLCRFRASARHHRTGVQLRMQVVCRGLRAVVPVVGIYVHVVRRSGSSGACFRKSFASSIDPMPADYNHPRCIDVVWIWPWPGAAIC